MSSSDAAGRVGIALELYELGERMFRQRIRRECPDATRDEIDADVGAWLRRRPGADHGDYPGPAIGPDPVNRIESALRGIASDLDALDVRWALIGGFAVSARTEPRFSRDVDVVVLVDGDPAAERLVRSLTGMGYGLDAIVEQESVGRLATARMIAPAPDRLGVVVDLIFATSGIEPEIVAAAEAMEVLPGPGSLWPAPAISWP